MEGCDRQASALQVKCIKGLSREADSLRALGLFIAEVDGVS